MSTTSLRSQAEIATVLNKGAAATLEAAWDVLERFGQALQTCDQTAAQVRLVLESVQESLAADAVFWFPGSGSDAPDYIGEPSLPVEWQHAFTRREVARATDDQGQFVRTFLDPGAKPSAPWPCSAAFVRVRASRGSWLVALSFHPRRIFVPLDLKLMLMARRLILSHRQHQQSYDKLKDSLIGLVRCLTGAIDAKDPFSLGHSERVGRIAFRLGKQMGLPPGTLSDLYLAGLLHDIGKIGLRENVLLKPESLSVEEITHVREHPVIGDRLVSNIRQLNHLRAGVRHHHERWDGTGYPDRLGGADIPLVPRILAVAEGCDAMMATRPYRPALPAPRVEAELRAGAGQQWDPALVDVFMSCRHELYAISQRGVGDTVSLGVE